jgi:hypothetical protein
MLAVGLVGCAPAPTETTEAPEPLELLKAAAGLIREVETFRLAVDVDGAPHLFEAILGDDGLVSAEFLRARAQYRAPDEFQGQVRIRYAVPIDVEVYANAVGQSYRLGNLPWIFGAFAPGFTPAMLLDEVSGFQAALTNMTDLVYVGRTSLEDGQPVHQVSGRANGAQVSSLVVGLINTTADIPLEVFVNTETGFPARITMRVPQPDGQESAFVIDIYDVNAPSEIVVPPTPQPRPTEAITAPSDLLTQPTAEATP